MPTPARFVVLVLGFATTVIVSMGSSPAGAASPEGIDSDAQAAPDPVQLHASRQDPRGSGQRYLELSEHCQSGFHFRRSVREGKLLKGGQIACFPPWKNFMVAEPSIRALCRS
jgi:hypothetical protein